VTPIASTGLYRSGAAAFFVTALPGVWRADSRFARTPDLERFLQGVIAHELAHTRHLAPLLSRIKEITRRHGIDGVHLDDDIVQTRFQKAPGFQAAIEAEIEMFFRAAATPDPTARKALATRALSLAKARRERHFRGAESVYAELEDVFLSLEGVGQWAAFSLARARGSRATPDQALIDFVRDNRRYWSQEEGFAQVLLLERLVPEWQGLVLGPDLVSPRALLDEAVRGPGSR
jgi:hypothetical protein